MLHRLELRNRLAELLPVFRVFDGVIERALREPDHLRTDADAPLVQRFDRDLVALADVAEDVEARHAASFEEQLARAARADAELVFLPADGESVEPALDQECLNPAIAAVGIDDGVNDEQGGLLTVDRT